VTVQRDRTGSRVRLFAVELGLISCVFAVSCVSDTKPAGGNAAHVDQPSAGSATAAASSSDDPALTRREVLARLDARIDEAAAKAHLDARLALDEAMPIPYLGVDSEPADGAMTITSVYAMTGAEAAGLKKGDRLLAIDAERTDSKPALARAIRLKKVGAPVTLRVQRDGHELTLAAKLGPRPEEDEDEEEQFPDLPARAAPSREPITFAFDHDESGAAPKQFDFALGGHGEPGRWIVSNGALRQDSADPTGIRFPMALVQGFDATDVVACVRFRYVGGKVDRAGGIVLRFADPANYYVARANAAEGDLRIFRVANGTRRTLPGGIVKGATDDDRWHTLEFRIEGSKLVATLDGQFTATAYDSYFLRGRVGLWTKSDSQTEFDDLTFQPIAASAPKESARR
jgi:hypothetical protein